MRIVLIHRYFAPDTPPYAHILRDIALRLGEDGHEVTVLTCQPSYNRAVVDRAPKVERLADNVTVRRWPVFDDRTSAPLKALNLATFCVRLLASRARLGRVEVIMAASTPPVAPAKAASWLARLCGAKFVYHKQDIYPEVVTAPGMLRAGRLADLLRRIDARTERAAAEVVVLSKDMAATVRSRGAGAERVAVINNFDPWTGASPAGSARREQGRAPLRVVFAGNLGRFQNIEAVLDAMVKVGADDRVRLDFLGDGALRSELEATVEARGLTNVSFRGYQAPEEVARVLREEADLGVVSLVAGVIRAAYPSKTMSYLRNGCPVLALVEADSELARAVVAAGAGVQHDPADAGGLADLLLELAGRRDELAVMRDHALALYRTQFDPQLQLAKWAELFASLDGERVGAP
ncbi:MAG TPA: glycosyltransferase family 4 protein [Acidimicrobiales bacterium]|jgi:glycosyltransferase involved in cell wall biosynthesis|nr:glycosyltransferase family 4 protein [Acidimicrobiales bacterium]